MKSNPEAPDLLDRARAKLGDIPIKHAMVAFTPGTDQIVVVPYPDKSGWCTKLALIYTIGASANYWKAMNKRDRQLALLADAMTIVVENKCPPAAVHRALSVIPEYRALVGEQAAWPPLRRRQSAIQAEKLA